MSDAHSGGPTQKQPGKNKRWNWVVNEAIEKCPTESSRYHGSTKTTTITNTNPITSHKTLLYTYEAFDHMHLAHLLLVPLPRHGRQSQLRITAQVSQASKPPVTQAYGQEPPYIGLAQIV